MSIKADRVTDDVMKALERGAGPGSFKMPSQDQSTGEMLS